MRKPRLRVGVFADAPLQSRWIVEALARAGATHHAEIAVVAISERPGRSQVPLLWRAYRRADRALFGSAAGWSGRRDLNLLAPRERRITMGEDRADWRARIRDARLDVAFSLGAMDDTLLDGLARYGTWRFSFGGGDTREPIAGLREVLSSNPVMASGIRIRRAGQPDRIACASWGRTFDFSLARSRDALFAKTSEFVARALRDLHAGGCRWIEGATELAPEAAREGFPGVGGLLRDIGTMGTRIARRATERALTVEEWSIAFRFAKEEPWSGSLDGFHRLDPPKGGFWADPFPIERDGRHYIFFEELPPGASKAHISVVEVARDGTASAPVKVLERDYHLSYPFLVEEEGALYMIPETAHNNTVEIYRCEEFPHRWVLERVLLQDVFCADATLHREDGKWWMFANSARPGEEINDELHLYSADRLLGEWTPHRRNPVRSDVRGSRPAGRLFRDRGRLYRPGQICAPLYGSGITVNHVTCLNADEYAEEPAHSILPESAAILGIHTINRAGDLSVTDAFVRRSRF